MASNVQAEQPDSKWPAGSLPRFSNPAEIHIPHSGRQWGPRSLVQGAQGQRRLGSLYTWDRCGRGIWPFELRFPIAGLDIGVTDLDILKPHHNEPGGSFPTLVLHASVLPQSWYPMYIPFVHHHHCNDTEKNQHPRQLHPAVLSFQAIQPLRHVT